MNDTTLGRALTPRLAAQAPPTGCGCCPSTARSNDTTSRSPASQRAATPAYAGSSSC